MNESRQECGVQVGSIETWKRCSAAAAVGRPSCGFHEQSYSFIEALRGGHVDKERKRKEMQIDDERSEVQL